LRNLIPRLARVAVQDSRGNWIARDAGGSATVARYTNVREETSEGENIDLGDVELENTGSASKGKNKGKGRAEDTTASVVDQRKRNGRSAAKRQKFFHDLDFLEVQQPVDGPLLPSSVSTLWFLRFSVLSLCHALQGFTQVYTVLCKHVLQ